MTRTDWHVGFLPTHLLFTISLIAQSGTPQQYSSSTFFVSPLCWPKEVVNTQNSSFHLLLKLQHS